MARPNLPKRLLQFLLPAALILGVANWGVYLLRPASLWITIPIAGIVLGIAAHQAWFGRHHPPSLFFTRIEGHGELDMPSAAAWRDEAVGSSGIADRSLAGLPMCGCDITKPFG